MSVVGIDAGYRNLGFCVLNEEGEVVEAKRQDLRVSYNLGKISVDNMFKAAMLFCDENADALLKAKDIALERQIRKSFIVFNIVVRARHRGRCTIIHPHSISAKFKLARKRDQKKKDAVAWVNKRKYILPQDNKEKQDDVADAILLAVYLHDKRKNTPHKR